MKKLCISSLVFLLSMGSAFASTAPDQALIEEVKSNLNDVLSESSVGTCQSILASRMDTEAMDFFGFLEKHFQSKASTSSLANTAIVRYGEYKQTLKDIFNTVSVKGLGGVDQQFEFDASAECSQVTEAYTLIGKRKLLSHLENSSSAKQTTVMVEKYKAINDRMRDLHFATARMFGLFETFKNRLPGFLQNCITK